MSSSETNEVSVTVRGIDPRAVVVLRQATELARAGGQWLRPEHLVAALVAGLPGEQSLFERWWPRSGGAEPDPYDGEGAAARALELGELADLVRRMLPPGVPGQPESAGPGVDYSVAGPDAAAYRTLIESPDSGISVRPRRYADYEPEQGR